MLSSHGRKGILENIFSLVLWKPIDIQHILDELTSVVTNIQFTPTPEKSGNPTSSHTCRCNGFWILFGQKNPKQLCCPRYLNGTLQVCNSITPSYTISLSAALKRNMDINLTRIDCENDVNLSPLVHNSRTFLSTHRPEFLSLPQDAHPLLSSASTIPLVPQLVARTLHNSVT